MFILESTFNLLTEQGGYFYNLEDYSAVFFWQFNSFLNFFLFFSPYFLFSYLIYFFLLVYLTIFLLFLLLILTNNIFYPQFVLNFFEVIFFTFLSLAAFLLNKLKLVRIHSNHSNFTYKVRINFLDNAYLILPSNLSRDFVWRVWTFFLRVVQVNNLVLYFNYFFIYLFRFFFLNLSFFFLLIIWRLKRFIFFFFNRYFFYLFFIFQFCILYLYTLLIYKNLGTFSRRIWLNYYKSFYLDFFFKLLINFFLTLKIKPALKVGLNLNFFSVFRYVNFRFFSLLFVFFKKLLAKFKISFFFLLLLKNFFYFVFFFLYRVCGLGYNFFFYQMYFLSFYITILYIFIKKVFYLSLFLYTILKRMVFFFFFYLCLPLLLLFFHFFFRLIDFILTKTYFFQFLLFLLAASIFIFFTSLEPYNFLLGFLDLLHYILSFFLANLYFLSDLNFLYLVDYNFNSFFDLTPLHKKNIISEEYSLLTDNILNLKTIFLLNFPYKFYLLVTGSLIYFKNIIFYLFYFNYFFFFFWYLQFLLIFKTALVIIMLSWFNLLIETITSTALEKGVFSFFYYHFWVLYSQQNFSFFTPFFYFFKQVDFFFLKLLSIDFDANLANIKDLTEVKQFFFTSLLSYFFVIYDYFFVRGDSSFFDIYVEDLNLITDNKIYFKYRLKSRLYRYYLAYYKYYYKYKYPGNGLFFLNEDVVHNSSPFHRYKHKTRTVPSFGRTQILNLKILLPKLYKKWRFLLYVKLKYKFIWGSRFHIFQKKNSWLNELYRSNLFFYNDNLNPLFSTFSYSFFTLDQKPGFGYYPVDSLYNINIVFFIIALIIFFSVFSSFRSLYFPKLWFVNNSEFLWKRVLNDREKFSFTLYQDRSEELPLGVTEKELITGSRFTYKELAERAGLMKPDFISIFLDESYSSYYNNRYTSEFEKLVVFDYLCKNLIDENPYITPMYLRESYHRFTEMGTDVKEYLSVPYRYDLENRDNVLKSLNEFFFKVDKTLNFNLPDWSFHKELSNHAYYRFPDGTYYIPHDVSNLFESLNVWLILFPLTVYRLASFEFLFSMDSWLMTDIFYKVSTILNLSGLFDVFFYFVHQDLIVLDPDTLNSQWNFLRGVFDDRFFFSKTPVFYHYYEELYYKDFHVLSTIKGFLTSISIFKLNFKALFLVLPMFLFYFSSIFFFSFFNRIPKLFHIDYSNSSLLTKLNLYNYKKYINKKIIYGFNNKT